MPLSEHEQRLLEQMERALYQEDPKFATALRSGGSARAGRRWVVIGSLVFLAGIGLLLTGVVTTAVVVGVLGFVAMLGGGFLAITALRAPRGAEPAAAPAARRGGGRGAPRARPAAAGPRRTGGFMQRLEARWRRRREERGF